MPLSVPARHTFLLAERQLEDLKARWFAAGALATGLPLVAVWLFIHFTGGNV